MESHKDEVGEQFYLYDEKAFVSPSLMEDRFLCFFYKHIMKEPVQTERGNLSCRKCYMESQDARESNICPIDGKPINNERTFQDIYVSRQIGKLECWCINEIYGCGWRGILDDVHSHHGRCEFIPTTCDVCQAIVVKKNLQKHVDDECPKRHLKCIFCLDTFKSDEKQNHERDCDQRPFDCPFKCHKKVNKAELFQHIHHCFGVTCETQCPFGNFGCAYKTSSDSPLHSHMHDDMRTHTAMIISNLVLLQSENEKIRNDIKNEENVCVHLINKTDDLTQKLEEQKQRNKDLEHQLKITTEEFLSYKELCEEMLSNAEQHVNQYNLETNDKIQQLISMHNKLDHYMRRGDITPAVTNMADLRQLSNEYEVIGQRIEQLETSQAIATSNLADMDLKLQLLENTTYHGRQIWKIDNISYRMKQAVSGRITALHSAPCYTKLFGYKFCTRVYLNGDGTGKGSHLSIFFVVMKSQYDDLNKWPLAKRVTFQLLNHDDLSRSKKETFISDQKSLSFRKPRKEMNVAAGCPMFIEKGQLLDGGFIIDDCLFIETEVEDILKEPVEHAEEDD